MSSASGSAFRLNATKYASFDSYEFVNYRNNFDVDKMLSYTPRGYGLLPMHLGEEPLKPELESLIFRTLIKLANKVTSRMQCVKCETKRSST